MAYNIPEKYQDLTPAPQLDKKTLNKMVWLSCFLQASFNYERMQACGFTWAMLPALEKVYGDDKEKLSAAMTDESGIYQYTSKPSRLSDGLDDVLGGRWRNP